MPPMAFFLLGLIWAVISPVASAADDDYHLASIWCASGKPELCYKTPSSNQYLVPKAFTELPPCYVNWPRVDKSPACANSQSSQLTLSDRVNTGAYPNIYYKTTSIFASLDLFSSVIKIRIFNVLLASILFFLAIYVANFTVRRSLILAWGVSIIPVGVFYIASTNPSSWAIAGIGVFWVFLLSLNYQFKRDSKKFVLSLFGLLISITIAIGARYDSAVYLNLSAVAVLILLFNKEWAKKNYFKLIFGIFFILIPFTFYLFIRFSNRWGRILEFPSAQEAPNDQPNAVINTLIELPAFIVGVFGGQAPDWVQRYGDLGRDFAFGIGWLEFNLPSITGTLIGGAALSAFLLGFNQTTIKKSLAIVTLFFPLIGLILYSRAAYGFRDGTYFQPRYFLPLLIVLIGIALLNTKETPIFTNFQSHLIFLMVLIGSIAAWQATTTRYTVNPLAAFTNFGQKLEWWPLSETISRFDLFIFSFMVHILWLTSTVLTWSRTKYLDQKSYNI